MDTLQALKKAVDLTGGQTGMARSLGPPVRQGHVWKWLNRSRQAPSEQVIPIVRATGGRITPHDLRPDLYPDADWMPRLELNDEQKRFSSAEAQGR